MKLSNEQIQGLIRHTLTSIGGALVLLGLMQEGVVTEIVGGVMTAVGYVWSYLNKN
jgi:uncharacterized membrane protein